MAKVNVPRPGDVLRTHEGGIAKRIDAEEQLRRSVCACLLWEKTFYEDGVDIALRIAEGIKNVSPEFAANLAVEARTKMKLRHAPLWIVRAMAALPSHKHLVASTLASVVQRADELTEFMSLYWIDGKKTPVSAQAKKGLATAFTNFNEFQFAKYMQANTKSTIRLRDVMFLCHPKAKDEVQAALFKKIANKEKLEVPDTWEVALSTGKDKRETWERLMNEQKLGGLALIRNLRNMEQVKVTPALIKQAIANMRTERILPFRFISAAKYAPAYETELEGAMLKCLEHQDKIPGSTVLLIDVSGSMGGPISGKSELDRQEAASALAILCREKCEDVAIYTFSNQLVRVPARRGFALGEAIDKSQRHNRTYLAKAITEITEPYDRIIVFTDEQSHDGIRSPKAGSKGYLINVAAHQNGVGYKGSWQHVDGFSEACVDYILQLENTPIADEGEQQQDSAQVG